MKLRHAVAVATATVILGAASAAHAAGPPYTVSVGGSTVYDPSHPVGGTSVGAVAMSARNAASTVITTNCTSATLNGTVTSGSGINPVFVLPSSSWSGCTVPVGVATFVQGSTWNFVGTGTNASSGMETVAGYLSNVRYTMSSVTPGLCTFRVEGYARASFDEGTQRLVVNETGYTGNLRIVSASLCLGQLQVGNPVNMTISLAVSSPDGVVNLS